MPQRLVGPLPVNESFATRDAIPVPASTQKTPAIIANAMRTTGKTIEKASDLIDRLIFFGSRWLVGSSPEPTPCVRGIDLLIQGAIAEVNSKPPVRLMMPPRESDAISAMPIIAAEKAQNNRSSRLMARVSARA